MKRQCEICLDEIFESMWDTECKRCQEIKKNHPEVSRWVVEVIGARIKASADDLEKRMKAPFVTLTPPVPQPSASLACDACGRHTITVVRNERGTFCLGCSTL